ncbi:hypothetical protein [Undibacterium sp. Ren11W]|uniref:hypothetical protein n=1 Tax=Undibacterium sp. Ren11W TaxID=3413045 RepID=UPI003BEFBD3D
MSTTPMKTRSKFLLSLVAVTLALAAYYLLRDNSLRFKEEVQLASGEIIQVARAFKTEAFSELGGPGGWEAKFNSMVIIKPVRADNPPMWQSDAGLIPILFDQDSQTKEWFVVTTFYSCEAWYQLGRPKLPYAEFRLRNGQWLSVPFSPLHIGRAANVLTRISNKKELPLHTLATKRERMSDPRTADEYIKIVDHWSTGC